jgi:hypothetical protein
MPGLPIRLRAYERENRKPERGESLAQWPGFLLAIVYLSLRRSCDEDEAALDERLRKIAKAPVPKDARPKVIKPAGETANDRVATLSPADEKALLSFAQSTN